jgi:hypothetical protein
MSVIWTWPLAVHLRDHIPGLSGDNFSFLWNLWWMRKALSAPDLSFFHSPYLFSPFGVDLVNHPHTALQGFISATVLSRLSVVEAENVYVLVSVFLNAACAYALAFDIVRQRRPALFAGIAFGGSPYIAAHLYGHFDLLSAWVIPLFALFLRRALQSGRLLPAFGCGLSVSIAAYSAYYYVVYLAVFALAYVVSSWSVRGMGSDPVPFFVTGSDPMTVSGTGSDPFFWRERQSRAAFTIRLVIVALIAIDLFVMLLILLTGGTSIFVFDVAISAGTVRNPLAVLWLLAIAWLLAKWTLPIRFTRPSSETFWRATQAVTITTAVFAVLCLPLIIQAFKLVSSGRYVSQVYFWRSAPRGVDALSTVIGNPFHPMVGSPVTSVYGRLGLDRIEGVGWIGVVPIVVLLFGRGTWFDSDEVRRWKGVLIVFAAWALGPFLTVAGIDVGLPLPQALARFVPIVENARMPGRAMVCVYLSLGILMALRLASVVPTFRSAPNVVFARPAVQWALLVLLAFDYLGAPVPLTTLDRPAIYHQLATIQDEGAVIEVPFGIGDGLSPGIGDQNRRILYYATIHGHPVVGGYIGRMPPGVAQAYESMPIVGNLLRLSSGLEAIEEVGPPALPFRYLVLDIRTASPELREYIRSSLDIDLIASGNGKELYAVQGAKSPNFRASK